MVEILRHWNAHQNDVLDQAAGARAPEGRERLHIVQGLIVGAANAQAIVKIFQQAADRTAAKLEIQKRYKLSEIQAETIAQMTLSQVTKLDAGRVRGGAKDPGDADRGAGGHAGGPGAAGEDA